MCGTCDVFCIKELAIVVVDCVFDSTWCQQLTNMSCILQFSNGSTFGYVTYILCVAVYLRAVYCAFISRRIRAKNT